MLLQNKTGDAFMSKTNKIQINQYFCNAIMSMALTFKMLSLWTKLMTLLTYKVNKHLVIF